MPPDAKTSLRTELTHTQHALMDVLDRIGPDDWSRPSPNDGWTVRDLLAHLATAETAFVPTLRRMAAGQGGVSQEFDPNRWNGGQLRRQAGSTPPELRAQLEAAHVEMLQVLDAADDSALDQRGRLSSGVEGSTEDNFRLVAAHKRSHTEDILAALAPSAPR